MKLIALAAALAFSGAAHAQTVPQSSSEGVQTVDDPRGGYEPTRPLFSKPPVPGETVVFVPSTLTPTEAYPPPPPQASYPYCRPGQFDNCMQRHDPK